MDNIIDIRDLNFKYGDKEVFNNANLKIEKSKFVSIIGKSSSGKSTLVKLLLGIEKTMSYINISGYLLSDFYLKEIRRIIGYVPTLDDNYFVGQTIMDDLAFTLENLQYKKQEIITSINNIAKEFKIGHLLLKESRELSDRDKQKVAIARALIANPKIIILDNCLYNSSSKDRKMIFNILKSYQQKRGLTVILVTNDVEDIILSDYTIILEDKKIYLDNTIDILNSNKLRKMGIDLPFSLTLGKRLHTNNCYSLESLVDRL